MVGLQQQHTHLEGWPWFSIGLDPFGGIILIILTLLIVKYIMRVKSDPSHRSRTIYICVNEGYSC